MPVHRRITALLAALSTLAGGPLAASAVADTDADAETSGRGARPALRAAPPDHVAAQTARASALARALGVSDARLDAVLRELRAERRATDVTGARPPVRSAAQLAAERDAYAAALAAKVGTDPATVTAALDASTTHPSAGGTTADRTTDDGTTNRGTANDAATDEVTTDGGTTDSGAAHDATTNGGTANDATADGGPGPASVRPPAAPGT